MGVFELYTDKDEKFRFRILDDGKETIACSIPYDSKDDAIAGIEETRNCAAAAHIADRSGQSGLDSP